MNVRARVRESRRDGWLFTAEPIIGLPASTSDVAIPCHDISNSDTYRKYWVLSLRLIHGDSGYHQTHSHVTQPYMISH